MSILHHAALETVTQALLATPTEGGRRLKLLTMWINPMFSWKIHNAVRYVSKEPSSAVHVLVSLVYGNHLNLHKQYWTLVKRLSQLLKFIIL